MKRLKAILAKVLELDPEEVDEGTSAANTETWDSFHTLMLASEVERTFNVKFTIDELTAIKSMGDIKESLKRHGVKLEEG